MSRGHVGEGQRVLSNRQAQKLARWLRAGSLGRSHCSGRCYTSPGWHHEVHTGGQVVSAGAAWTLYSPRRGEYYDADGDWWVHGGPTSERHPNGWPELGPFGEGQRCMACPYPIDPEELVWFRRDDEDQDDYPVQGAVMHDRCAQVVNTGRDRVITPYSDPGRWTPTERQAFLLGRCSWDVADGKFCGVPSKDGASFGNCALHEEVLLEYHYPDGSNRPGDTPYGVEIVFNEHVARWGWWCPEHGASLVDYGEKWEADQEREVHLDVSHCAEILRHSR